MSEKRTAYQAPVYGQAPAYGTTGDDEIDLARLWALMIDNRWILVGFVGAALLAGLLYAYMATPIYRADALLQIEKEQKTLPGLSEMAGLFSETSDAQTEIELIRSRMVLGEAVDRLDLDILIRPERGFFASRFGDRYRPGFGEAPAFAQYHGEEGDVIIQGLTVPEHYRGQILTLVAGEQGRYTVLHGDTEMFAGRVGETSGANNIELKVALLDAEPGMRFQLAKRARLNVAGSLNANLSVSEKGKDTGILAMSFTHPSPSRAEAILNAIAEVYRDQNLQRRSAEAEKSLAFLEEQLPEIKADLTEAEEKLNEYRSQRDSVDLTLETESKLTRLVELETRLSELSIKENELQQRFTREHPSYRILVEQRSSLEREKEKLQKEIEGLPETQQEILRLRRDMEVNQEIYMQLRNKAQELRVLKAGTVASVRIVDDALTSPAPVKPGKRKIVLLSLVLGGMLGVGYVLLRAFFNRAIKSPEELEALEMNVYASLPISQKQKELDEAGKKDGDGVMPLLARHAPTDLTIEGLRSLRTSLHFAMLDAASNVLMLSGPTPGVGKSFISANLGVILAQTDQRVLLVDADLRKGHLHRYFNAKSGPGLSECLAGKAQVDEVIQHTDEDGLDFLPRGEVPPNPAELLMNKRMRELVERLGERYDRVIIDTPPVLAVTDPAIVAQYAGATMLVVRYNVNAVKEVEVAAKRFEQNGVKIKGVILNAIEYSRTHVYGYYPYQYPSAADQRNNRAP